MKSDVKTGISLEDETKLNFETVASSGYLESIENQINSLNKLKKNNKLTSSVNNSIGELKLISKISNKDSIALQFFKEAIKQYKEKQDFMNALENIINIFYSNQELFDKKNLENYNILKQVCDNDFYNLSIYIKTSVLYAKYTDCTYTERFLLQKALDKYIEAFETLQEELKVKEVIKEVKELKEVEELKELKELISNHLNNILILYNELGKPKDGIDFFEKKKQEIGNDIIYNDILHILCTCYIEAEQFDEANELINKINHGRKNSSKICYELKILMADKFKDLLNKLDEALDTIKDLKEKDFKDEDLRIKYLCTMGEIRQKQKKYSDAKDVYKRTLKVKNNDFWTIKKIAEIYFEENISIYELESSFTKDFGDTNNTINNIYFEFGNLFLDNNKFIDAIEVFKLALENNTNTSNDNLEIELYSSIALAHYRNKNIDNAIETLYELLSKYPTDPLTKVNLGVCFTNKHDLIAAEQFDKEVIETDAYFKAEQLFKEVIETDIYFKDAHINLANLYIEQNKLKETEEICKYALQLFPKNDDLFNALANYYLKMAQGNDIDSQQKHKYLDQSMSYLKEIEKINNNHFYGICTFGEIFEEKQDYIKAAEYYIKAFKINKEDDWVLGKLRSIKEKMHKLNINASNRLTTLFAKWEKELDVTF